MHVVAVNWVTVSAFTTGAGTLVLAVATFASVRSANNAARTAERSLQVNLRPLLFPSRLQDPPVKVIWPERRWSKVGGGRASLEHLDDALFMTMSVRNVGSGIAVIHGWWASGEWLRGVNEHAPLDQFRMQTRDLYIPAGDVSFWQGAIREPTTSTDLAIIDAVDKHEEFTVELLYGDHEGGQRTISRFSLVPLDGDDADWMCQVVRHWNLDRPDPR